MSVFRVTKVCPCFGPRVSRQTAPVTTITQLVLLYGLIGLIKNNCVALEASGVLTLTLVGFNHTFGQSLASYRNVGLTEYSWPLVT